MYEIIYDNENGIVKCQKTENDCFSVYVTTKEYSGGFEFCIEKDNLYVDIEELNKIYNELSGCYIMNDMDSDAYLKFEMLQFGKMIFSGQLGGTHTNNYLIFEFEADQTLLYNLIEFLTDHKG